MSPIPYKIDSFDLILYLFHRIKMQVISNFNLNIHHGLDIPLQIIPDGEYFGILELDIAKTTILPAPLFLLCSIDNTGSMDECGGKGLSKMHYVKETFKKMIQFLSEKEAEIYVRVHAFNETVSVVVESTRISKETIGSIIQTIQNLTPDKCTAIDIALTEAEKAMQEYSRCNPSHVISHIFMTDGQPTAGNRNYKDLVNMVSADFTTAFIGFGEGHNSTLLRKCSENGKDSTYDFVDDIENTGIVYGDIIHSLLYPAVFEPKIETEMGKIYNWKTNEWTTSIIDSTLIGDSKRIYHVKTYDPNLFIAKIYGKLTSSESASVDELNFAAVLPALINGETGEEMSSHTDLTKYLFRHATLELLYKVRSSWDHDVVASKSDICDLFRKMKVYMRMNNMLEDPMMKQLCDDLYITYKNIGQVNGEMYASARYNSQGRQQSHNITTPRSASSQTTQVDRFDLNTRFERQNACTINYITPLQNPSDLEDIFTGFGQEPSIPRISRQEDDIDLHDMSTDPVSCFASQSATQTMRSLREPYGSPNPSLN